MPRVNNNFFVMRAWINFRKNKGFRQPDKKSQTMVQRGNILYPYKLKTDSIILVKSLVI